MASFEDFHIVARKEVSDRVAELLTASGVQIERRIITEIGRPEFVIAVAVENIERAEQIIRENIDFEKVFTSGPGNDDHAP